VTRRGLLALAALPALPQAGQDVEKSGEKPVEFLCPMDADVRQKGPGKCPRCGMRLEANLPDFLEYPVLLRSTPRAIRPGVETGLTFEVKHPKTGQRVTKFEVVHEKLFHLFLISEDFSYFAHEHPVPGPDGLFHHQAVFPKPGLYRALADFYPAGGTPQMPVKTIYAGRPEGRPAPLKPGLEPQRDRNITVELATEPARPWAGKKTLLFFRITPAEGLEPYLGAWGHLLAASQDLVDLTHAHPFLADGGPQVQFNLIFARPGVHRVWVQFQRQGVVNTLAFNVPVYELGA